MLEILAIIYLGRANSRNADMRGRNTTWAKVYTALLWIFFELSFGAFFLIVAVAGDLYSELYMIGYIFMILGAGIGALLSWLIAKRGQPIRAVSSNLTAHETAAIQNPYPLSAPCVVAITRQKSVVGMAINIKILLNGQYVVDVGNGETKYFPTYVVNNVITAEDYLGTRFKSSVSFGAPIGGKVEISLKGGKFLPELTRIYPGPGSVTAAYQ